MGGYMAEASIIYPLIVLICVLMISVAAFLYDTAQTLCEMEIVTRHMADEETETVLHQLQNEESYYEAINGKFEVNNRRELLIECSEANVNIRYAPGPLKEYVQGLTIKHSYIDECKIIRQKKLVEDLTEEFGT